MTSPPELAAAMRDRLAWWPVRELPDQAGGRRAAVAVPLIERASQLHVLLIKRVPRGRNAGQWALPGGRIDPGESSREAALRELAEETGLVCTPADVLGRLDDVATGSGHLISPCVIAVQGPRPVPRRNPGEVASLHPIPLERLLAPGVPRWKATPTGPLLQMPLRHDMVVHAPTGAILWQFAEVALRGRDLRLDGVREPAFVRT